MYLTWEDMLARPYMGCSLRDCEARAECLLDGVAYCLDCAELVIERLEAVALYPGLRSQLPELTAY